MIIRPVTREGWLPASFTQEERLSEGRYVQLVNHKIAVGIRFDGPLDVALVERCVAELAARHESLRTTFPLDPAGHRMRIAPEYTEPFRVLDAPSYEEALRMLSDFACQDFDLAAGPLFRCALARVAGTDGTLNVLCVNLDHVITDAWSVGLLMRDLVVSYAAHSAGEEPRLPELAVQFPDFVAWERDYLTGKVLDRMTAYWHKQLDGIDPIPASGLVDRHHTPDGPPRLVKLSEHLGAEFSARTEAFAEAHAVSVTSVVSAALKATMRRYRLETLDEDAAGDVATLGSLANRAKPELADVVGYIAVVTTSRTRFTGATTFRELVALDNQTLWNGMRHQSMSHSLIMKQLGSPQYGCRFRDPELIPSYMQFDFDLLEDAQRPLPQPPGLTATVVGIPNPEVPRGGLRVIGYQRADGITLELRYRGDRYSAPWARAFLDDLVRQLGRGITDPDRSIA